MGYLASKGDSSPSAIKRGMIYGAALASITVEGFGVDQLKKKSRQEIDSRYQTLRDLVTP
jgi:hypothetical protein